MAKSRRVSGSGPARRRAILVWVTILLAAAVGVLFGLRPHHRSTAVLPPAPQPSQVQDAAPHPSPPEPQPQSLLPTTDIPPAAKAPPVPEPEPQAAKETASSRTTRPNRPTRPAAFAGETAFVKDAGNKIALTFDAGASPAPTPALLDLLLKEGLKVTFFLTGRWCEKSPELVKRIAAEGHEIANHTQSHKDMRKLTDDEIRDELADMNDVVVRLVGRDTVPYFRPPFGARDKRVLKTAADCGYASIYWSVDSWDAFKEGITSGEIKDRVLDRAQAGDIVLMHCGSRPTVDALPDIVSELRSRGLEIVTVSELMKHASPQ